MSRQRILCWSVTIFSAVIVDAPPREVLDRLQSPGLAEQQRLVDVYLGQDMFRTEVDGVPHAILNGWLGSVPFQNGMTYGDLLHLVKQQLPVSIYTPLPAIRDPSSSVARVSD